MENKTLIRKETKRLERLEKKSLVHYGSVPVYYGGFKKESKYKESSILDQINNSKNADEIETILKKGTSFKKVSQKTLNKWKNAAKMAAKRLAEI